MKRDAMRALLLDAAEAVLLEGGVHHATVRRITSAAGVNLASISTTFGGRGALLDALLVRLLIPVNEERARRYEALAPLEPTTQEIVRAFVEPLVAMAGRPSAIVSLLPTLIFDVEENRRPLDRVLIDPGTVRFVAELQRCGTVPDAESGARARLAIGTTLSFCAMSTPDQLSNRAIRDQLIAFVVAGLEASHA